MEPNLSRRRFLSLSAGVTAMGLMPLPVFATSPLLRHWTGSALGGPASIAIHYPDRAEADRLIGRCVAEIGRQPYIVYGLMRTEQGVSPNVGPISIWISMLGFTLIYALLAAVGFYLMHRYAHPGQPVHEASAPDVQAAAIY